MTDREKMIEEAAEAYPKEYELVHMNSDTPRLSGREYLSFGFKKGAHWAFAQSDAEIEALKSGTHYAELIHQRSIAFDQVREVQGKLEVAIKAMEEAISVEFIWRRSSEILDQAITKIRSKP